MNILILDDNIDKKTTIAEALSLSIPDCDIKWCDNYEAGMHYIIDNRDKIDLLMLDWNFPANSYSRNIYGLGRQVLNNMILNNIYIKTIICSPNLININKYEFPFVVGQIILEGPKNINEELIDYIDNKPNIEKTPVRVKNKKNNDTGYKRRMSSTPWWMK